MVIQGKKVAIFVIRANITIPTRAIPIMTGRIIPNSGVAVVPMISTDTAERGVVVSSFMFKIDQPSILLISSGSGSPMQQNQSSACASLAEPTRVITLPAISF